MWRPLASVDEDTLAEAWQSAAPFPHLVFDDVVTDEALDSLLAILDEEPVERREADIYAFDASAPEPVTDGLRRVRDAFGETFAGPLGRITSKSVGRVEMRAYAYREGDYLLPHADHQTGVGRELAFAYYVPSPDPPVGGELELFACSVDRKSGAIIGTSSAKLLEPRPNRLVVFDVSNVSLHQVREVLSGLRVSLSGWFYA